MRNPPLRRLVCVALLGLAAAGCTTLRETQPAHTATEELLVSHAAEIAAGKLAAALPVRASVYIDAAEFKGDNTAYGLAAIRAALMQRGATLVADKKDSAVTIELRAGALSIDQRDVVWGLPAGYLPIPDTATAFPIPEISVYSKNLRRGVAEFAAVAYETKSHALIAAVGPTGGVRDLIQRRYLTFIKVGSRLERPGLADAPPPPR